MLPRWAENLAYALPLTHVANVIRELGTGRMPPDLVCDILYLLVLTLPLNLLGIHLMKRRLVK